VDRKSPLGNPFYMRDESMREEVCDKFEVYFQEQVLTGRNPEALAYLNHLLELSRQTETLVLLCWCHPKRCHADTIAEWLNQQNCAECTKREKYAHLPICSVCAAEAYQKGEIHLDPEE